MNFTENFNESIKESKMASGKRKNGNADSTMEQPVNDSAKKHKRLYENENQANSAEGNFEQQYTEENFLRPACKNGNNSFSDCVPKMEEIMRKLADDAKMSVLKWMPLFGESEAFEACCSARLDEILKQAVDLERNLIEQKECLITRMNAVSRTLQLS